MIQGYSADPTSGSLRKVGVTSTRLRLLAGPAGQVRRTMLDDPFRYIGHDKRAPPIC